MLVKNLFFFIFFLSFLDFLFSLEYIVKVCIKENIKSFQITNNKNYVLIKSKDGKFLKVKGSLKIFLSKDNKIEILNKYYLPPIKIYSKDKIIIDGKIYMGEVEVLTKNNSLLLVNIIDIEKYLYGVVPYEVVGSWNDEMLKVQAVISRTYTISNLARHKEDGYDLCSSYHCQVYEGISEKMHQRVKKAVDETFGLVIVEDKKNSPIQAYYHAACGGATEDVKEVWSGVASFRYLCGVKCGYCKDSPHYNWSYQISKDEFIKLLKRNGFSLGGDIRSIKKFSSTKNGRVKELIIESNTSSFIIKAEELRKILGYTNIKSTKITKIELINKTISFYGKGWGHGVGLCQWGASFLTFNGKNFKEVIRYYYPNTTIRKYY
ncbi:MAG: SpoIID/LytB domain-containing protein [Elusimicrobiota bacterium]|nr:SpoIID/LytB domain-containing protein [Endomicrobiia bacterium]MDW8165421.1 SpoIID/LytB domain-containing protein [Elusimicrobiota bacterium]